LAAITVGFIGDLVGEKKTVPLSNPLSRCVATKFLIYFLLLIFGLCDFRRRRLLVVPVVEINFFIFFGRNGWGGRRGMGGGAFSP